VLFLLKNIINKLKVFYYIMNNNFILYILIFIFIITIFSIILKKNINLFENFELRPILLTSQNPILSPTNEPTTILEENIISSPYEEWLKQSQQFTLTPSTIYIPPESPYVISPTTTTKVSMYVPPESEYTIKSVSSTPSIRQLYPPPSETTLAPAPIAPPLSETTLAPAPIAPPPSETTLAPAPIAPPPSETTLAPAPIAPPPSETTLAPAPIAPPPSETTLAPAPIEPPPPSNRCISTELAGTAGVPSTISILTGQYAIINTNFEVGKSYTFNNLNRFNVLTDTENNILATGKDNIIWYPSNPLNSVHLHVYGDSNCSILNPNTYTRLSVYVNSSILSEDEYCIFNKMYKTSIIPSIVSGIINGEYIIFNTPLIVGNTYNFTSNINTTNLVLTDSDNNFLANGVGFVTWTAKMPLETVRVHVSKDKTCGPPYLIDRTRYTISSSIINNN
jgi:hypothetical protein